MAMPRVIVIGGANVDIKGRARDRYIAGTSNPGEVVVSAGGVGRNIAENLAHLGVATALMTFVGDDANGRMIRETCAAAGIDIAMIASCGAPTGIYLAILDETGEMVAAVNDMRATDMFTVAHLDARSTTLATADMLVADCNIPTACLAWLCEFAAERAIPLVIEPVSVPKARKLLDFKRPAPVFCITPNRQQVEALTGQAGIMSGLEALHRQGFSNVVAHCGSEGAFISDGIRPAIRVPAFPVANVADVTGAGDAAVAGLVCGLATGHDLARSARLGQASAAIKLQSRNSVAPALTRDRVFSLAGIS